MASKKEVKKGLKYSIYDGTASAMRKAINTKYLTPFLLFFGASNEFIGIANSIPNLLGHFSQMSTSFLLRIFKSKYKVTQYTAFLGRIMWLPMILAPAFLENGLWWALLFLTFSYIFRDIATTAWTSWMIDLVPEKHRGVYFGKRNMIGETFSLVAAFLAGWFLGIMNNYLGFLIIFLISTMFGMISNYYLTKIPDFGDHRSHHKMRFSYRHFIKGITHHSNFSNFTMYMFFMYLGINIVSPFFAVYMLKNLDIGYLWFAIVTSIYTLFMIIGHRYWGNLSDKFGDEPIMIITGSMLVLTPFIYLLSSTVFHLSLVNMIVGFSFAGFSLAQFNYLLDIVPKNESPVFISNYKFIIGLTAFTSPLIGGFLLDHVFNKITIMGYTGIYLLFILAIILRLLPNLFFFNRMKEIRIKRRSVLRNLFFQTIAVYPTVKILHEIKLLAHHLHRKQKK